MSLSPLRNALAQTGVAAFQLASPFKTDADEALRDFQTLRADLERQVRSGDITLKAARERAHSAARDLRGRLLNRAEQYSPTPRVFLDRLLAASDTRRRAREHRGLEALQRETNQLLRQVLVEQQLVNRALEFEGSAFVRPLTGGPAGPTLTSLLAFHEHAVQGADEAAAEWARRQLEGWRIRTSDPDELQRIDRATDRPHRVNPRTVQRYVDALRDRPAERMEQFVREAIEARDSAACAAAFLLAREAPEGLAARWVRQTLDKLAEFPDSALETLRSLEAEARRSDSDAAQATAEFTATIAEAEASFPDFQPPTPAELARRQQVVARPRARDDEPIGLNLSRRGQLPEDVSTVQHPSQSSDSTV